MRQGIPYRVMAACAFTIAGKIRNRTGFLTPGALPPADELHLKRVVKPATRGYSGPKPGRFANYARRAKPSQVESAQRMLDAGRERPRKTGLPGNFCRSIEELSGWLKHGTLIADAAGLSTTAA